MARSAGRTHPLLQLTYVSTARAFLKPDDFAAIRQACERNNPRLGFTGLLVHRGGRFFAAMEGPERALLARMEIIVTDPRHGGLRILSERRVEGRRFRNWSFAVLPDSGLGREPGRAEDLFITMLTSRLPVRSAQ